MTVIKTKDFKLRHVKLSDARVFFEAEQDKEARRNFMTTPKSVKEVEEDIKNEISQYEKEKPTSERFTIELNGKCAGWISINQLNTPFFEHKAKIDFCLHPEYRGKDIMTKIVKKKVEKKEEKSADKGEMIRTVGRRKRAAARVQIKPGTGEITVNGKPLAEYFPYFEWQTIVKAPLAATGKEKTFDVSVKIAGGGQKGQAVAVQHGISRALVLMNADLRKPLKTSGLLTRDPREKERRKVGCRKARKRPQYSKR